MACSEAEDAGGLTPAKDDNEAARHFIPRTLPILDCVDYITARSLKIHEKSIEREVELVYNTIIREGRPRK